MVSKAPFGPWTCPTEVKVIHEGTFFLGLGFCGLAKYTPLLAPSSCLHRPFPWTALVYRRKGRLTSRGSGKGEREPNIYLLPTKLREGNVFRCVCQSVFRCWGCIHLYSSPLATPFQDMFKLVHYETCTVCKLAFDIQLKCLFVSKVFLKKNP